MYGMFSGAGQQLHTAADALLRLQTDYTALLDKYEQLQAGMAQLVALAGDRHGHGQATPGTPALADSVAHKEAL